MITRELIQRINELSRKQRAEGLTPGEKEEQQKLRNLYLKGIRAKVADALESHGIKPVKKHNNSCRCGHCATEKRWKNN
ncbi:MAG: DUF896 domain-containing protein [Peptococcaceae bacterium]|nr:DUF896 domain-containing protein [Peptococcaceae bacterium]